MRSLIAVSAVVLAGVAAALAQQVAPVPLSRVVAGTPTVQRIPLDDRHFASLVTWRVTDSLAPYSGTTLVWLEVDEDDVRLVVDGEPRFEDIRTGGNASLVVVASGGMWRGAYDSPWRQRKPDGLVVAQGIPKSQIKEIDKGGLVVFCGDDVDIFPVARFPRQTVPNKVVIPCNKRAPSVLQSNVLLVLDGTAGVFRNDSPANRLAICAGDDHIVIAGAFNSFGQALTLPQFAEYIAAAAKERDIEDISALNLDGACAAQLYIPHLNLRYGCDGANYMVNRILMRRAQ